MKQYLDLLQDILDNGEEKDDRTGVGTLSVFGRQIRFDLRSSFPAVTTKKLAWKAVVSELLWFIEGSGDEGRLREILYGDREAKTDHGVYKKTIWSDNANAPYWQPKAEYPGDLGRVYGVQWRDFGGVDQLLTLIEGLKNDPNGRRHIVVSYNPGELDQMALPPCHAMFQMYVSKNKLSCQMYQRSGDAFLGIPFNIASYALLTHMIAQVCNMEVGELILVFGDVHIYKNHIDQVNELLSREPMEAPALYLNPGVKDINSFTMADINLVNYKSHPALTAPMAV
jgi:thymidylate synthase